MKMGWILKWKVNTRQSSSAHEHLQICKKAATEDANKLLLSRLSCYFYFKHSFIYTHSVWLFFAMFSLSRLLCAACFCFWCLDDFWLYESEWEEILCRRWDSSFASLPLLRLISLAVFMNEISVTEHWLWHDVVGVHTKVNDHSTRPNKTSNRPSKRYMKNLHREEVTCVA